jgi:hypothetical protein
MALYEAEESYLEGAWFVGVRKAFAPITNKYQQVLDKATPHTAYRWYFTAFIAVVRKYFSQVHPYVNFVVHIRCICCEFGF